MLMIVPMTMYLRAEIVLGPTAMPPSADLVESVLIQGKVDGALLAPAVIDQLCLEPDGLSALRGLDYIHYVGAPLCLDSDLGLAPHVRVIPSIGSTKCGGYFTKIRDDTAVDWDYVEFQPHIGAELEPRMNGLHELVFIRRPDAPMHQIFLIYPNRNHWETNNLWIEHPEQKGLWKIVGRADDYGYLAHGEGLYASTLEPELNRHEAVQAALIGGHGKPRPVVLIELRPSVQGKAEMEWSDMLKSLQPFMDRANARCHPAVRLSPDTVIFVKREKPLIQTMKGSVARMQSLKLYEAEIDDISQQ